MSRFETILNLIAGCQLHHKTGASASGSDPHPPDFLKHAQKVRLRRDAHGSIRIQEGQPEHIRACILDGFDGAGTRLALAGPPAAKAPAAPPAPAPAPANVAADPTQDLRAAAEARFAAQRQPVAA